MPNPSLETLGIKINADSTKALNGIVNLAQKLESLSQAVASVETGKINDIATSISNLGSALGSLSGYTSFTRLVDNINKLNNVQLTSLPNISAELNAFFQALQPFGGSDSSAKGVLEVASSLGKFGGANIKKAIIQLPLLTEALRDLMAQLSNAPTISQNTLDFVNALTQLASQGQHAGTAAQGLARATTIVGTATDKSRKKSLSLASAIGRMYAKYMIIIRGIKALGNAIKSTADYIESYNYFSVAFNKIGDEWQKEFKKYGYENAESYADSFAERLNAKFKQMSGITLDVESDLIKTTDVKSLGLNLTEITQYASAIGSITNAIGLTGEASLATSKAVTMLSADLGSLMNLDYSEVSGNLQSALNGQARAVYKYGIDTTSASLQAYAYANGVQESVNNLSQASKMQLRLLAILDQSKVAWADLAHTIESPNNQLRQLKNNLSELGQVIGQLFIPVLTKVLPYINGVTIALKRLFVSLAEILGIKLNLDEFGQGYTDALEEMEDDFGNVGKAAKDAKKSIREFDELKVIGDNSNKDIAGAVTDIDLTAEILDAVADYEKVWDEAYEKMTVKAQEIADVIGSAFDPIKKIFEDLSIGDFFSAGQDVSDWIYGIETTIGDLIESVDWNEIGRKVGDFIRGIDWIEVLKGLGQIILDALSAVIETAGGFFNAAPIETAIFLGIKTLKWKDDQGAFDALGEKIGTAIGKYIPSTMVTSVGILLTVGSINAIMKDGVDVNLEGDELKALLGSGIVGAGAGIALKTLLGIGTTSAMAITIPIALVLGIVAIGAAETVEAQQRRTKLREDFIESLGLNDLKAKITGVEIDNNSTKDSLAEALNNTDMLKLDDLASKYFELSSNYSNLTENEKGLLKFYAEELSSSVEGITQYIDEITGAWLGTEEQLDSLIKKQMSYYKMQAYGQAYSDAIVQQLEAEKNLTEAQNTEQDIVQQANEKRIVMIDRLNSVYQRLTRESKDFAIEVEKGNITFEDFVNKALGSQIQGKNGFTYTRTEGKYAGMDKAINLDTDTQKYIKEYLNYLDAANEAKLAANKAQTTLNEVNDFVAYAEKNLAEQSNLYYADGTNIVNNLANGVEDSIPKAIQALTELRTNFETAFDGIEDSQLITDTESAMTEIQNAILAGKQPSADAMKIVRNAVAMALDNLPKGRVKENIIKTMDTIVAGIENGDPEAVGAMVQLVADINTALNTIDYSRFSAYGGRISDALISGMKSALYAGLSDLDKIELEKKSGTSAYVGEFGNLTMPQIADLSQLNVAMKNGSYSKDKNYLSNFSYADMQTLADMIANATSKNDITVELGVNADGLLEVLNTQMSRANQASGKKQR